MKKWMIVIAIVLTLILLAVTAGWWLPPLLTFVGANSDLIQGLTDLVQLLLWIVAGIALVTGIYRRETVPVETEVAQAPSPVAARVDPSDDVEKAAQKYRQYLVDRYRFLDFRGMGVSDRVPLRLSLSDLYVPLRARIELPEGETWTRHLKIAGRELGEEEAEALGARVSEPRQVLHLLQENDGLIVLGDPGSGKTTFLKYLTLFLASGRQAEIGMDARLPFLVPLSAYAVALSDNGPPLDQFMVEYYESRGVELSIQVMLAQALESGGALLLLDGLDEVQRLEQRRAVVDQVVDFFAVQRQRGNKFVLSSRIIGYRDVRPTVDGLAECTLIDFDDEDIASFVQRWTHAVERSARGITPVARQEAEEERQELMAAMQHNQGVRQLAANPLLLTILALMKRQGVVLPERRVELYENYVQTFLKHWNLARGLGRASSRDLDVVETVRVLAPLALWMHQTSPGVGLVKQEDLRRRLIEIYAARDVDEPETAATQFLRDVRDHAGILLERGPREYGFIHLTFQEYLAGVAIALRAQQQIDPAVSLLASHIGDNNWHEVSLLTIGYLGLIQQRDEAAGAVLTELMAQAPGEAGAAVVLAGECVLDTWPGGVTTGCRKRVIQRLLAVMRDEGDVTPVRRAEAGRVLAKLGDPRVEVLDPLRIEWREVPAGTFIMGEGQEQFEYEISYDYRISRYPITNAQFGHFVADEGYSKAAYWPEAKASGIWTSEGFTGVYRNEERRQPNNIHGEPFRLPNCPVTGVNWYEALAFTRWLNERLAGVGLWPDGWRVTLPSEPEWEKAARGVDARWYPWGAELTLNHANFDRTGIKTTSVVGCFPGGASPYGVEEMSGNVFEWTRSVYAPYPYDPSDGREELGTGRTNRRVLRGGSFLFDTVDVRCAARYWLNPGGYLRDYGFRVCVAPLVPLGPMAPLDSETLINGAQRRLCSLGVGA